VIYVETNQARGFGGRLKDPTEYRKNPGGGPETKPLEADEFSAFLRLSFVCQKKIFTLE
jgi:hypothetical protein